MTFNKKSVSIAVFAVLAVVVVGAIVANHRYNKSVAAKPVAEKLATEKPDAVANKTEPGANKIVPPAMQDVSITTHEKVEAHYGLDALWATWLDSLRKSNQSTASFRASSSTESTTLAPSKESLSDAKDRALLIEDLDKQIFRVRQDISEFKQSERRDFLSGNRIMQETARSAVEFKENELAQLLRKREKLK